MSINIEAVNELIRSKFRNNKSWFAEEIGVARSYLSLVLKRKKNNTSKKIIDGIIKYCKRYGLDYNEYIFFGIKCE